MSEINKTEDDWQKELTLEQYQVLRQKGTEAPFSGKYVSANDKGMYVCAACGNKLFASDAKFNAHCGWPSFFQAVAPETIEVKEDLSYNMVRREVLCKKCGGHLGHVFNDGPKPTGQRYCVNSASLKFKKAGKAAKFIGDKLSSFDD